MHRCQRGGRRWCFHCASLHQQWVCTGAAVLAFLTTQSRGGVQQGNTPGIPASLLMSFKGITLLCCIACLQLGASVLRMPLYISASCKCSLLLMDCFSCILVFLHEGVLPIGGRDNVHDPDSCRSACFLAIGFRKKNVQESMLREVKKHK